MRYMCVESQIFTFGIACCVREMKKLHPLAQNIRRIWDHHCDDVQYRSTFYFDGTTISPHPQDFLLAPVCYYTLWLEKDLSIVAQMVRQVLSWERERIYSRLAVVSTYASQHCQRIRTPTLVIKWRTVVPFWFIFLGSVQHALNSQFQNAMPRGPKYLFNSQGLSEELPEQGAIFWCFLIVVNGSPHPF